MIVSIYDEDNRPVRFELVSGETAKIVTQHGKIDTYLYSRAGWRLLHTEEGPTVFGSHGRTILEGLGYSEYVGIADTSIGVMRYYQKPDPGKIYSLIRQHHARLDQIETMYRNGKLTDSEAKKMLGE